MKKLLTLAFILLGSLCATSQEVKEYDQYKKTSNIKMMGKYDFVLNEYKTEKIDSTTIKFMKLSSSEIEGIEFIRFNIDMGMGFTTQDYLILNVDIINYNSNLFNSLELLSPFGDEMLFLYNEKEIYLFYNLVECSPKSKPIYKRYYWGNIIED